jgi:hypothetical protein
MFQSEPTHVQASFYSSQTMTDVASFPVFGKDTSASFPVVGQRRKNRRWTRRAFLVVSGAALGAGGLGLGYAAYHSLVTKSQIMSSMMHTPVKPAQTHPVLPQQAVPTKATSMQVFSQHQQTVRSVTWSPDSKMLASGANDALVLIWGLDGTVREEKRQESIVHSVSWLNLHKYIPLQLQPSRGRPDSLNSWFQVGWINRPLSGIQPPIHHKLFIPGIPLRSNQLPGRRMDKR